MKRTKLTIPRLARFYDNQKVKVQFTYRNASFTTSQQGPLGNQYWMNYAFIRADNPNDPGGTLSGRNAQFWNTIKANYNKFTCLYSKCRVKWQNLSGGAQSGWCYLMPIRAADLVFFVPNASTPNVPIDTVKESHYAHVKSYQAGYGQNCMLKYSASMSSPKLFGTPYDPSQDDQGVASVTTSDKTWYWLYVWVSETANSFTSAIEFTVDYYVTLKETINPDIYE